VPNPRLSSNVRQRVKERAGFRCEYCLCPETFSSSNFSVEHIVPRAQQGSSTLDNLALSCQQCNNAKFVSTAAPDPETKEMAPLYDPRRHRWAEHFCWSEDTLMMLGQTPTGRATVERLQLNREGVVNLRGLLLLAGKHPPVNLE
jgi:hypothetical protein